MILNTRIGSQVKKNIDLQTKVFGFFLPPLEQYNSRVIGIYSKRFACSDTFVLVNIQSA